MSSYRKPRPAYLPLLLLFVTATLVMVQIGRMGSTATAPMVTSMPEPTANPSTPWPTPTAFISEGEQARLEEAILGAIGETELREGCYKLTTPSQWANDLVYLGYQDDIWPDLAVIQEWHVPMNGEICGVSLAMVFNNPEAADRRFQTELTTKTMGNNPDLLEDWFDSWGYELASSTRCDPNGWCTTVTVEAISEGTLGGQRNLVLLVMTGNWGYAEGTQESAAEVENRMYWESYAEPVIQTVMGIDDLP